MHWAELGTLGHAPPLLLLHGLNDCYRTWRDLAPELARDRLVLMPDLPGHGLSERPDATYELEWYARMLAQWLAAVGLHRVDIVGHSFGGGVAQMALLECPELCRRLVLVSSGGLGREIALALRLAAVPGVVERLGQPFMKACTRFAVRATGDVISQRDAARLARINGQPRSARAFARTLRDLIDWRGQRRALLQRAHEIPELPPIAVFWGDRDRIIPVSHARCLGRSLEGIRVVEFEGCGHYPHHEKPGAFVDALRGFLDEPSVPRASLRDVRGMGPRVGGPATA